MTITVELPDNLEDALKAQANAQGLSEAGYIRTVLERDLRASSGASLAPFKTGQGSLGKYGTAPAADDIAANRADMFQPGKRKRLSELFAPLSGIDIDLRRNPSTGRPIIL